MIISAKASNGLPIAIENLSTGHEEGAGNVENFEVTFDVVSLDDNFTDITDDVVISVTTKGLGFVNNSIVTASFNGLKHVANFSVNKIVDSEDSMSYGNGSGLFGTNMHFGKSTFFTVHLDFVGISRMSPTSIKASASLVNNSSSTSIFKAVATAE